MTESSFAAQKLSHAGQTRTANQDWCEITAVRHPNGVYHLLVLADGMGGGLKGDVASRTAVEAVVDYFGSTRWYNPEEAAREAVFSANRAVWDRGTGGGQATKSYMGTTLVFALFEEATNRVWFANVGDSRGYLLRAGRLEQATRDHSVVGEFGTEGAMLSPEEVARMRHMVTRAIGLEPTVEPDILGPFELDPGDRVLLSSDGLHGVVPDERIQRLATIPALEKATSSLVRSANDAGGPDNITVVVGGRESARTLLTNERRLPVLVVAALAVLVATVSALLGVLVANWLRDDGDETDPPSVETVPPQIPRSEEFCNKIEDRWLIDYLDEDCP